MGVTKKVNSLLQPVEKKIQNHLVQMNVSCHRLIYLIPYYGYYL